MPEFMVMILGDEAEENRLAPSEIKALVEGQTAYEQNLRRATVLVDGGRLRPSSEGRRVSLREGQPVVEAGPFPEPPLGAYYVLQAENLDAALRLAEQCPRPRGAALDVRPIMKGETTPDKSDLPGGVFAFAVLGKAATEKAWIDVMDRIDANTRQKFPSDRWLGGVRLEAPGRGRRIEPATHGRAGIALTELGSAQRSRRGRVREPSQGSRMIDAPFLESKEVIGGLFFMRMSGLDEAVRWVIQTDFVRHGTIEVRELWRS